MVGRWSVVRWSVGGRWLVGGRLEMKIVRISSLFTIQKRYHLFGSLQMLFKLSRFSIGFL